MVGSHVGQRRFSHVLGLSVYGVAASVGRDIGDTTFKCVLG